MMFKHKKIDLGYEDLKAENLETGRVYKTPDGDFPSITTVLGALTNKSIEDWKKRVGEEEANRISYRATTRGTAVHEIIEKYLENESTSGYMPHIVQSLTNLKPILDKRIGEIYAQECPLYSAHLGVAGRTDCVAEFDGVVSICDWKTSRFPKKKEKIGNYFIQACAYSIMWEERTGIPAPNLVIVMDVDNFHPCVYKEKRDDWVDKLKDVIKLYHEKNSN